VGSIEQVIDELPPMDEEGMIPKANLGTREKVLHSHTLVEYLVKWKGPPKEEASWKPFSALEGYVALLEAYGLTK